MSTGCEFPFAEQCMEMTWFSCEWIYRWHIFIPIVLHKDSFSREAKVNLGLAMGYSSMTWLRKPLIFLKISDFALQWEISSSTFSNFDLMECRSASHSLPRSICFSKKPAYTIFPHALFCFYNFLFCSWSDLWLGTLSSRNIDGDGDAVGNHSLCTVNLIDVIDIRPLSIRMTSCQKVRNQLLISHDEGVLNDHKLLLLCNLDWSNILNLLSNAFIDFNFDLETTIACPNFASTNANCPFSLSCTME